MTARRQRLDRYVVARIAAANRGRDTDVLPRKFAALAESPFRFFRGTAHLFWDDWRRAPPDCDTGPRTWCCGDLHIENFGSFRGDNGLAYFDINNFDEAASGPALADPLRCLTSIWLAAAGLGLRTTCNPSRTGSASSASRGIATCCGMRWRRWVA